MDNLMDILVYLIPVAIFVLSRLFGKSAKTQQKNRKVEAPIEHSNLRDFLLDMEENEKRPMADLFFGQHSEEPRPQPEPTAQNVERQEPKSEIETFAEGEKAIIVDDQEETEKLTPEEKPKFDAREAIIYSTIIERKYC